MSSSRSALGTRHSALGTRHSALGTRHSAEILSRSGETETSQRHPAFRCWSKWHAALFGIVLATSFAAPSCAQVVIADSVAEFSNVQGQSGWEYGFYDGPFTPSDFQRLPFYGPICAGGGFPEVRWHRNACIGGWWTTISATTSHPNGARLGDNFRRRTEENWAVRRWTSSQSGYVTISGWINHSNPLPPTELVNGMICRIFIDGTERMTQIVPSDQATPIPYALTACLEVGSIVDFVTDPRDNLDYSDGALFTATITTCLADLNCDGGVTSEDFFAFLGCFFGNLPCADFNRDGSNTSQDFFDFLAAFFAGC